MSDNWWVENEKRAQDLNNALNKRGGYDQSVVSRQACEKFLDQILSLPADQQLHALKRAQEINDQYRRNNDRLPGLHIRFDDLNGDGKREELSDFKLHVMHSGFGIEVFDLYDPPKR